VFLQLFQRPILLQVIVRLLLLKLHSSLRCQVFVDLQKVRERGVLEKWSPKFIRVGFQDICPKNAPFSFVRGTINSVFAAKAFKASVCHPSSFDMKDDDYIHMLVQNLKLLPRVWTWTFVKYYVCWTVVWFSKSRVFLLKPH